MESLLTDDGNEGSNQSLAKVLKSTEANILESSKELKEIVIESGHMAESLFESVSDGYSELTVRFQRFSADSARNLLTEKSRNLLMFYRKKSKACPMWNKF